MNIQIRTHKNELSEGLQKYVERRMAFTLDRHLSKVGQVSVYLDDVNGPKGGVDKICQVKVELAGQRPVEILEESSTFAGAVDGAARRLGYRMQQVLRRRRPEEIAHRLRRVPDGELA